MKSQIRIASRPIGLRALLTNKLTIAVLAIIALFVLGQIAAPGSWASTM